MERSIAVVDSEREIRAWGIAQARASSRLEGVDLSPGGQAVAQRYIDGEIDSDQLVQEMAKLHLG
jgi:hypothetical protein